MLYYNVLCLACLHFLVYCCNCQTASYKAAVVEYQPIVNDVDANTDRYIKILDGIPEDVDVIVFPEATLSSTHSASEVPSALSKIVLCNSTDNKSSEFLKKISCAAIKKNATVVVNIDEKENCTEKQQSVCSETGTVMYNCDVVFDNKGTVIAKYRKWNIYGETFNVKPPTLELPLVQIKNVTFGIFTSFDVLFSEPALNVTRDLNVRNVLFPTMWFDGLPFLTAIQTQQMFAEENQIALLAANANNPNEGGGGSGIYLGQFGALVEETVSAGGTKVLITEVPNLEIENNPLFPNATPITEDVDVIAKNMDNFKMLVDPSLSDYNSSILDLNATTTDKDTKEETICHGSDGYDICCEFKIEISKNTSIIKDTNYYTYLLVAASHLRTFGGFRDLGVENCAVIACLNESLASCGQRFPNYTQVAWPVVFEHISITASFKNDRDHIQYPNSLLSSIRPIPPQSRSWTKTVKENRIVRSHILNAPQNRLLTFGIYGRDFSRDARSGVVKISTNTCLITLVVTICWLKIVG